MKAWREKNRERLKAYKKEYEKTHREQTLAMKRREYRRHREHYKEKSREWYANHREQHIAYGREYVVNHKEEVAEYKARWHMRKWYRLTQEDYDRILAGQDGRCAICGTETPGAGRERFNVDHGHDKSNVRGLLCMTCNGGLGMFRDNPKLLLAAVAYLEARGY